MSRRSSDPLEIRMLETVFGPGHEPFFGDLAAVYRRTLRESGAVRARVRLWAHLTFSIPRLILFDISSAREMISNYVKVAIRQINRYRLFSAVNIFGLALSMSVCLVILNLIIDQRSFDNFHPAADRIYRVTTHMSGAWGNAELATSAAPLGPALLEQDDGIERLVRMRRSRARIESSIPTAAVYTGLYAENGFFDLFGFDLMSGRKETALRDPDSIVLSEDLARRLFDDRDPLGEILEREDGLHLTVTGVFAAAPGKTHIAADALLSFETLRTMARAGTEMHLDDWNVASQYYNYVRLAPDVSRDRIRLLADRLVASNRTSTAEDEGAPLSHVRHSVQAISEINLGRDISNQIAEVMDASFVRILGLFAMILVGMAVFNYVNLTVSRSLRRAREIGIRKVVGARRAQISAQLVLESVLTAVFALAVATAVQFWLIPQFNALSIVTPTENGMALPGIRPRLLFQAAVFAVMTGIVAGIIPAIRMSDLAPVRILKGTRQTRGGKRIPLKKALVVAQFVISMVVISVTLLAWRQSTFITTADYGFDEEQVVHLALDGFDYNVVAERMRSIPGVVAVAATSSVPSGPSTSATDIRTEDMEESEYIMMYAVDEHFLSQYRVDLVAGRGFSDANPGDAASSILITRAAVDMLGFESADRAVGQQVSYDTWSLDEPVTIIGVVDDFYSRGFDEGYVPVSLAYRPDAWQYASIRINPERLAAVLADIEDRWHEIAAGLPATYSFFDEDIRSRYRDWSDIIRILGTFATIIVIIASLGLLGMATYSVENRIREVGIRKALGAGSDQIVLMLSKEYLILMSIAVIVAAPIAVIVGGKLLAESPNHVELGAGTILAGVLPVLLISLATVATQTLRAARLNPVDVIREE